MIDAIPAMAFYRLCQSAIKFSTEDDDGGRKAWINSRSDYPEDVCSNVWDATHLTVNQIRQFTGMSQIGFCRAYCIPRNTLQCWEYGDRSATLFTRLALAELTGAVKLPKRV